MRQKKTIIIDGEFNFSQLWKKHFADAGVDDIWINPPKEEGDENAPWRDAGGAPRVNGQSSRLTPFDEAMHMEPYPTTGSGVIQFQANIVHPGFWISTRRVLLEYFGHRHLSRPGFQHIFSVIKEGRLRKFNFRVVVLLPPPPDPDSPTGLWQGSCWVPVLDFSRHGCGESQPSKFRLGIESGGEESGIWTGGHHFLGIK